MNSGRIKEIQETTAYPKSLSVKQALLQVWNECEQEHNSKVEKLNLLRVKHRFCFDMSGWCREDYNRYNAFIKKYPPKIILTNSKIGTPSNFDELIY